ncbi:hypothetical protein ACHAPQ_008714 [Fusarium lateritium]
MCFGSRSKEMEYDVAPQPAMNYANDTRRNHKYSNTASYNPNSVKKPRRRGGRHNNNGAIAAMAGAAASSGGGGGGGGGGC